MGEREKYNPMFYFGKRTTIDEIKNNSILSWLVPVMQRQNSTSAILCDCGCIISNPEENSMTVEEYENSLLDKGQAKQIIF